MLSASTTSLYINISVPLKIWKRYASEPCGANANFTNLTNVMLVF